MDDLSKIKRSLCNIAGVQKGHIFTAQVKSVESETCTVALGKASISRVRLRAVVNGKDEKLYIKPKKDSYILAVDLSNGDYRDLAVLTYSEVETINIKIAETTIDIDKDGIIFNGGKNNGLVFVEKMVEWMQKVHNDLATLQTQLSTHPTEGQGAALGLVFNPTTTSPTMPDFENTKIKQ
jgi:hypothetical protein